jgi:putative ABC transport system permease protein
VRDGGVAQVQAELRGRPWIASVTSTRSVIGTFFESTAQTWLIMSFFVLLFAGGTAFSVVYNHARISLSERSRELASLRILGLSRGDVTRIVLGELAVLVGLAIPVGMGLGWLMTYAIIVILQTELYRIPMNITPKTLSIATVTLLVIAGISALVVARRIHRLDLIGVLKTRAS